MKAIEPSSVADVENLDYRFSEFSGRVYRYKEQIASGKIELTGDPKGSEATTAVDALLGASKEWRVHIDRLRALTAQVRFLT